MKKPTLLCILDGIGEREATADNAVTCAKTPTLNSLKQTCPTSLLRTDGPFVGLPEGQMGNSEVGHTTIGAGRILKQNLERISENLQSGALEQTENWQKTIKIAESAPKIHVIGLISNGGVHSHSDHIIGLIKMLATTGTPIKIHAITDGRDVAPKSAERLVPLFEQKIDKYPNAKIASLIGRYFAMDRDNREERTAKAFNLYTNLQGNETFSTLAALETAYASGETDEFIEPFTLDPEGKIEPEDLIICANFRSDRMRQLTRAFINGGFKNIVTLTTYDADFGDNVTVLFPPEKPQNTLGEIIATSGLSQLRIAETEKYPHVTYFMNGGWREEPFENEDRILVPSPKVATYDLQPEMSLPEVTAKTLAAIESEKYDLIVLNMANGDMVGHTGVLEAAIKAVEEVDKSLGQILEALKNKGGQALILADHGNCEQMRMASGSPHTAHTTNPVRCYLFGRIEPIHNGSLADIAPTVLHLLGLNVPGEMTGIPLQKSREIVK